MMTTIRNTPRARRSRTMTALAIAAFTGTLAACNLGDALDVDAPSRIPAGTLETPSNATLLVNSAIGDFECAYGAYVVAGGLIGEESVDGLQTADRYPYDRRSTQPSDRRYAVSACDAVGVYTPMQTARVSAENVIRLLKKLTDADVSNRAQLIAKAAAHAG